ncbi:HlyD family secretion protein [Limnoglobus roseus]|uniref:Multidrug transporter n=1 Tax=Limnoglobus roseus TaxID=2598579 RepID=A0A5C1AFB6_9BACT|nr:biotin/lipoyl-binding protein [Limnoglobus roseus]QEL18109.1 multidrug transporter [Limnoglobus roseus]
MLTRYILPLLGLIAFAFAVQQMTQAQQKTPPAVPPVEPAKSPFAKQLAGSGIIEPETENISIGTNLPGIVERVNVKVGDMVRPGVPLFRLDDRQLNAELVVRKAFLENAQATLEKLNNAPRPEELPPLRAKVAEMVANLDDQTKQLTRLQRLGAAASEDELTRREAGVAVAKAQLERAKADLALQEAGSWKFDRLVSQSAVKQAQAQVEQTGIELTRLTVKAPQLKWDATNSASDATEYKVLQVNVRPGEFVGTVQGQALIVLGYIGKLHVRVDIDENDIGRFRPNLPGFAQPRGNPHVKFPISFVRVEPYVIPKKSLTGLNTERVDTRVLQVIYRIESADLALYVGQQMEVFLNAAEGK